MTTTFTLTGNFADLLGVDIPGSKIVASLGTNLGTVALVDLDANKVYPPKPVRLAVADDGSFSVTLTATNSTGTNVSDGSLRYIVRAEIPDGRRGKITWDSGYFELTANTDLSDVIGTAFLPPTFAAEKIAEMEALLAEAEAITGLTGEDAAVANLLANPTSDTFAASDAATATQIGDPGSEVATALEDRYARGVSVTAAMAGGSSFDAAFASASEAVNAGFADTVYLPAQDFTSSGVTLPKGRVVGAGIGATKILITDGGNGLQYHATAGASNPRRIEICHLTIDSSTADTGVGVSIFSAALVDVHHVHTHRFAHGVVLSAVTHGDIDKCTFENFGTTGVWIPNGEDYLPGYPAISPPQNNRITVKRCNIRSDNATSVGVCDDGGWNHEVSNNSFEGCGTQLRIAGVEAFVASNNEYESADGTSFIVLAATSRAGTAVGSVVSVTLADSVLDAPVTQKGVTVEGAAGAVKVLHLSNFAFHNTTGVAALNGLDKVERLFMTGTRQWGSGTLTDGTRATVAHFAPNSDKSDLNLLGGRLTTTGANGSDTVLLDLGNGTMNGGSTALAYGVGRGDPAARGTLDLCGGTADTTGHGLRMLVNGSLAAEVLGNGAGSLFRLSEARDISLGTTTGSKIGTAAGQKLAFWGVTPRTQPGSYSVSNPTALRSFDGSATSATTLGEVIQVLGRLITDLKSTGIIG